MDTFRLISFFIAEYRTVLRTKRDISQAVVRICTANTATATTAELAVADISVPETIKQGIKDVSLVGGLPHRIESLDDVVTVISYRRTRNGNGQPRVPFANIMGSTWEFWRPICHLSSRPRLLGQPATHLG